MIRARANEQEDGAIYVSSFPSSFRSLNFHFYHLGCFSVRSNNSSHGHCTDYG